MKTNEDSRRGEYAARYGLLMLGALASGVWGSYYAEFIKRYNISFFWGYIIPLALVSLLLIGPDVFRISRGLLLLATTNVAFPNIVRCVTSSTELRGAPLFYIDKADQNAFQVTSDSVLFRIGLSLRRFMFHEFPVVYYNVTAKEFLNWIDYLYLNLLRNMKHTLGAEIVVALHFDEAIYREGFFTDVVRAQYQTLFDKAARLTKKVVGNDTEVVDERWYIQRGSKGARRFAEYFFGVMIAKMNDFAAEIEAGSLTFKKFYRAETNLISILPTIISAQRYGHLFVVDYEGSFDIWNQTPFSEHKRKHHIFFIKGRTIQGPQGERIPAWSPQDGINITDDTHVLRNKIDKLDDTMLDVILDAIDKPGLEALPTAEKQRHVYEEIGRIKAKHGI